MRPKKQSVTIFIVPRKIKKQWPRDLLTDETGNLEKPIIAG